MPPRSPARLRALLPALLLAAAGAGLYARSLPAPFLFDDVPAIVENPHLRSLWPLSSALDAPPQSSVAGRPLASLSFALSYAVSGLDPRGWRALNVALHVACALLLFGFARRTLARVAAVSDASRGLALAIALLWLVHPLATEAVAYVTQRTELLVSAALLACLYAALRGFEREAAGRSARGWFALAVAAAWLGVAAKEVMAAAPPLLLLYDRAFASGSFRAALRRHGALHAGVFASWLGLALLVLGEPRGDTVGFGLPISSPAYATTQIGVVAWYLRLAFWPAPLVIAHDWPVARGLADVWASACLVGGLLAATLWASARAPRAGFLGAWLFLILAPSSSFVPIVSELAAERRMYLPLAAPIAAGVLGAHALLRARPPRALRAGLVALAALALGALSAQRLELYRSPLALWSQVLEVYPLHRLRDRIESEIAQQLARDGRLAEAVPHFVLAAELRPGSAANWANLGRARLGEGSLELALAALARALELDPNRAVAHADLGLALAKLGRYAEAEPELERALALDPAQSSARRALARVLVRAGESLVAGGEPEAALPRFKRAVELDPQFQAAQQDLVGALMRLQTERRTRPGGEGRIEGGRADGPGGASDGEGRAAGKL